MHQVVNRYIINPWCLVRESQATSN